jgi:hypothetical protein
MYKFSPSQEGLHHACWIALLVACHMLMHEVQEPLLALYSPGDRLTWLVSIATRNCFLVLLH